MPLFTIVKTDLSRIPQTNFNQERELQNLIEKNLDVAFNCRFVASEFSTGAEHAGRIDTLALSEDNNPVIIEYKKVESSDLINQSLSATGRQPTSSITPCSRSYVPWKSDLASVL